MGLLKLNSNPENSKWAQKKAKEIIDSIPSQNLVSEAYLFGSGAACSFTDDSDLDLLVVTMDEASIKVLQKEVYRARFSDIATDWIFKTKSSFEERKNFGGVCFEAFHHGVKIK